MTRPTPGMKKAMVDALLGDEQKGEDPTTLRLEQKVAEIFEKDTAMFFPSATMANQVAILVQCGRGEEIIASDNAHIYFAEGGGPAIWAGALARSIPAPTGVFTGAQLRQRFSPRGMGPNHPPSSLVVIENTTNAGGGTAWPVSELESVWNVCRELKLSSHLDGSRVFNAATAVQRSAAAITRGFDTVTLCLSKGLGCPAGAVLSFPAKLKDTIRLWKQRMGGSLRQSGMLAAAGLYALEHHVERLSQDHENASLLADGLSAIDGINVEVSPLRTNMVYFNLKSAMTSEEWNSACTKKGFRFSELEPNRYRAVTHLDVSSEDIKRVVKGVKEIAAQW